MSRRDPTAITLNAALAAAEAGEPMPLTTTLARQAGCTPANISMAIRRLVNRGVLRVVSPRGHRRVIEVVATGRRSG